MIERVAAVLAKGRDCAMHFPCEFCPEPPDDFGVPGCLWMARAAIEAIDGSDLVLLMDESKLTGLVMSLTGGSANPAVVRGQIARLQRKAREHAAALSPPAGSESQAGG